jgi:hypothetical protein
MLNSSKNEANLHKIYHKNQDSVNLTLRIITQDAPKTPRAEQKNCKQEKLRQLTQRKRGIELNRL